MRKIITVGLGFLILLVVGLGSILLVLRNLDIVIPHELQVVNVPEIQPFLAGRTGFRGIYWNIDSNEISFAFLTTLNTAEHYFEAIHPVVQANDWQLIHSSSLKRIYQLSEKKPYGISGMMVVWQISLSYDPSLSEVTLNLVTERYYL